jgi:lipopolysaccharide biosynthesis glycosyltransferase
MNKKVINIVCVSDNNYIQHLGVMTESLFYNNQDYSINLYLLNIKISDENLSFYKKIFIKYKQTLHLIERDNNIFNDFIEKNHITKTAYQKILIPEILNFLDKVLFLDCDMVINSSISELWGIDVTYSYLAAVQNISRHFLDKTFNSGVMLLNLKKMRQDSLSSKMFDYLKNNSASLKLHDQAGYNKLVNMDWIKIDLKWNLQSFVLMSKYKYMNFPRQSVKNAINNPAIIHYSARIKPWQFIDNSRYKKIYYQYLKLTPWKGYISRPTSFKDYFFRIFLRITPKWFYLFLLQIRVILSNLNFSINRKNE